MAYKHRDGEIEIDTVEYQDGSICTRTWRKNGILHNTVGPAFVAYDRDGSLIQEDYCVYGRDIDNPSNFDWPLSQKDIETIKVFNKLKHT